MRARTQILSIAAATALSVAAWMPSARAQTFPADSEFVPFHCGLVNMQDGFMDEAGALADRDLVGTDSDPAGYRAFDPSFLYIRMRLDDDPIPAGAISASYWGLEVSIDSDPTDYELLLQVDGVTGNVLIYENDMVTVADSPTDPANTPALFSYPVATHAESTVAAGTMNGGNTDYFLTFAIPWNDLTPLGLDVDTPVRVWMASSATPNALDGDFACHDGTTGDPALSDFDDYSTVIDDELDSDGDGWTDEEEFQAGTDPQDPDSHPAPPPEAEFAGGGGCGVAVAPTGGPGLPGALAGLLMMACAWWSNRLLCRRK